MDAQQTPPQQCPNVVSQLRAFVQGNLSTVQLPEYPSDDELFDLEWDLISQAREKASSLSKPNPSLLIAIEKLNHAKGQYVTNTSG